MCSKPLIFIVQKQTGFRFWNTATNKQLIIMPLRGCSHHTSYSVILPLKIHQMCSKPKLDLDTLKTKQPIASGGLCPQTPCFIDSLLGLAPPSENPRSSPDPFINRSKKIINFHTTVSYYFSASYMWKYAT